MAQINTYSPDGTSRLCVQYDRNGSVTLGLQNAEPLPAALVNVDTGRVVEVDADDVTFSVPPRFDDLGGHWMPMDRGGINNLIRSLREARDKAYGRDE